MTRAIVEERLLKVLKHIQERAGQEPVELNDSGCPLRDLPLFDSLLALEASVELETELGCTSEDNLFFDDRTKQPLNVAEIVDRLCSRLGCAERPNG